jgi:hypothetical protein
VKRRNGLGALLAVAAGPALTFGPSARARSLRVRRGDRLHDAVAAARDGDTVELEAGAHHGQTALITQRQLTLRGVGGRAVLHADGAHEAGKALIVVRGGQVRIEDLEFRGARVPDGNGAGIRFEQGALTLQRCAFFDNEMGLLSSNTPDADLVVEDCEFGAAPRHEGALHHLLYVGTLRSLTLSGSRFWGGWRGHLVKSRAARNLIRCNQLLDGDSGGASYELDLPNAGLAWVLGNVIGQGPRQQNPALLAYGADGQPHPDSALYVAHNSFVNGAAWPATFVRHWPERLPPGTPVVLRNNLLAGPAMPGSGGRREDGNLALRLDDLDPSAGPRVLPRPGLTWPVVANAGDGRGLSLTPTHEITFPVGLRPLAARDAWRPGAFQD